jgi:hypothetical protein
VRNTIWTSLRKSSGPLRRIDPLSRQEMVAAWIGVLHVLNRRRLAEFADIDVRFVWERRGRRLGRPSLR